MQYPTPVQQIHHHHMTRLIFDDIKIPEVISDDISSDYIFWGSLVTVIRWHIFSGQRWPAMLFTSPTTEPWQPSHRGNQLQGSVYKSRDKFDTNERRICVDQERLWSIFFSSFPFANVFSMADGPLGQSSGTVRAPHEVIREALEKLFFRNNS